ncbi:hypothetical protein Rs2_19163 [Raphanus sativus]|nr:hypothetical protein Rs2_19163 [Raphanus sativus]
MASFSSFSVRIALLFLVFCLIGLQAADDLPEQTRGDVCSGVSDPGGCPINCFRADPVCGANGVSAGFDPWQHGQMPWVIKVIKTALNGVTYSCGCPDAACHGVRVVKRGACGGS